MPARKGCRIVTEAKPRSVSGACNRSRGWSRPLRMVKIASAIKDVEELEEALSNADSRTNLEARLNFG